MQKDLVIHREIHFILSLTYENVYVNGALFQFHQFSGFETSINTVRIKEIYKL